MKRWIFLTCSLTAMAVVSIWTIEGCHRSLPLPTFPATATAVPPVYTATATKTPTNTASPAPTSTPTATRTQTPTWTPSATGQATATNTPTSTITDTPTNSPTPTVTNTPTSTPTACSPVVQATYTFDSGTECWNFDASGAMAGLETVGDSSTTVHSGTGAWEGIINYSGPATQEEVSISLPCGTFFNLTGATVTIYVYVTAAVNGQLFCNFGTSSSSCYTGYENPGYNSDGTGLGQTGTSAYPLATNTWVPMYLKPTFATNGGQFVSKFGVNIANITSPVTVYIDDVSITTSSVPTATPTNTPTPVATWNFEDNTADSWVTAGGNVTGVVMSIMAPGQTGGGTDYCVNLNTPFTGINQASGIQQGFTTPLNLTGGGIACYMWIDSGTVPGGYPGGQIFPQDNTGTTSYSFYQNLTPGAWTYLNLTAANFGGVNAAAITQITIQAATGGGGTPTTGNVKIDDIVAY